MFPGDHRSKRPVHLGGRSRKEATREETLARLKRERETRRRLQLENASATKIQVCLSDKEGRKT